MQCIQFSRKMIQQLDDHTKSIFHNQIHNNATGLYTDLRNQAQYNIILMEEEIKGSYIIIDVSNEKRWQA